MNLFQRQFTLLSDAWKNGYGAEVKRTSAAFFLLILISFGVSTALPELRSSVVKDIMSLFGSMDITNEAGALSAPALLTNNVRACVFAMLYGLIPFIQLPALAVGMNALLIGILAAHTIAGGTSPLVCLLSLLPHGIFELPALVLAFAMGLYVCGQMTRRVRKDASALPIWECVSRISALLLAALFPLLAVAAIVEAHLTPLLLSLFI